MDRLATLFRTISHFVHRYFIWFVISSYLVAGVFPGPGQWIRHVSFGEISILGGATKITLPMVMLAFLLLNAGLGIQASQFRHIWRASLILAVGLAANLLIPILYIFGISNVMQFWHNPAEVQVILVGLALVASMPIAGSSTAWSQNANGDMTLSLGLVLFSTFLSPFTTPIGLHAVGFVTTGDYSEDLHELAATGTGGFLAVAVLLPSLLGILFHFVIGESKIKTAKPHLKLVNSMNLLLLNYSNASLSLPQTINNPDWDFLGAILLIVIGLCATAFFAGWLAGRLLKAGFTRRISLLFGLGMNNNGTGLVLASLALADHPRVLLPIIFYNLVQHLVAGSVDFAISRQPAYTAAASQDVAPTEAVKQEATNGKNEWGMVNTEATMKRE